MGDMFTPAERSRIMSKVKSRNNVATELRLVLIFKEFGIRGWRRRMVVFGRPDFVFPAARLAVFVDGCFWHACPAHGSLPETNRAFWTQKFGRNKERDRVVSLKLKGLGWRVLRLWQHDLREPDRVARRILRLIAR
jgi:DNA mismatch endonuclease (patch repair protein)